MLQYIGKKMDHWALSKQLKEVSEHFAQALIWAGFNYGSDYSLVGYRQIAFYGVLPNTPMTDVLAEVLLDFGYQNVHFAYSDKTNKTFVLKKKDDAIINLRNTLTAE